MAKKVSKNAYTWDSAIVTFWSARNDWDICATTLGRAGAGFHRARARGNETPLKQIFV